MQIGFVISSGSAGQGVTRPSAGSPLSIFLSDDQISDFADIGAVLGSLSFSTGSRRAAALTLSRSTISVDALVGDFLGTIGAQSMSLAYTLVDDADGQFELAGNLVKVASALTAGATSITVRGTDENGWSKQVEFPISIIDDDPPAPVLSGQPLGLLLALTNA